MSQRRKVSLNWVMENLEIGCVISELRAIPHDWDFDQSEKVARGLIDCINSVEIGNKTPGWLFTIGMNNLKKLVEIPKQFNLEGQLSLMEVITQMNAAISDAAVENIKGPSLSTSITRFWQARRGCIFSTNLKGNNRWIINCYAHTVDL